MERLTEYEVVSGHVHAVPTGDVNKAMMRLAAYEDTGLEPEQCENAKIIIESAFSDDTSKAERIRELLKADKEGRVVVLPCKVGDTVWSISNKICKEKLRHHNRCYDCNGTEFWNNCFRANDASFSVEFEYDMIEEIGKTVFLTREEAERALEAMKNE